MTTPAQVEANRRNAQRSTGPKTARGKALARQNAMKDGLTGGGIVLTLEDQAEVDRLLPAYREHYRPANDVDEANIKRVLIETVRSERCYRDENKLKRQEMFRLMIAWVEDHEAEAALLAGQLEARPEVIAPQLNRTLWGAYWQIERWGYLLSVVESGQDWDEVECTLALNLLGVAHSMRRKGLTKLDPPAGSDPIEHHRQVAQDRIDWLCERAEGPLAMIDEEKQISTANDLLMIEHPQLMRLRRCEAATLRSLYKARKALAERNPSELGSMRTAAATAAPAPMAASIATPSVAPSRAVAVESPRQAPMAPPVPAAAAAPAPVPAAAASPSQKVQSPSATPVRNTGPMTGWQAMQASNPLLSAFAAATSSATAVNRPEPPSDEGGSYLEHFRRLETWLKEDQSDPESDESAWKGGRSVASHAVQP